jgi:hypothetical protein
VGDAYDYAREHEKPVVYCRVTIEIDPGFAALVRMGGLAGA